MHSEHLSEERSILYPRNDVFVILGNGFTANNIGRSNTIPLLITCTCLAITERASKQSIYNYIGTRGKLPTALLQSLRAMRENKQLTSSATI